MFNLGIIGLGTMGANLARNAARNGARVILFNRTSEKTDLFMEKYGREGVFIAAHSCPVFLAAFTGRRSILLMVKAGESTDEVIDELAGSLQKDDIIIDGGNSHYRDTQRREERLKEKGIFFIGMGVSGGEKGALEGPSMMPSGDEDAIDYLLPLFSKMAAKDGAGGRCITRIGPGGSGHFVKMVHNGIEYGVMQLIAESYDILKTLGKQSNAELADTFATWNKAPGLSSFLMEITAKIFEKKDPETGKDLIDMIKDSVGQKGTGKWTTEAAFDLGQATPTIDAAVAARLLSGDPKRSVRERRKIPHVYDDQHPIPTPLKLRGEVAAALECSIMCTYNQGFHLMERASAAHEWNIPCAEVARIWRGGCIIRSELLEMFQHACSTDKATANRVTEEKILRRFDGDQQRDWRRVIALAAARGVPVSAMAATLSYFDAIGRDWLPANLIAAQRDFFGAHGFERTDREGISHGTFTS